MEARRRLHGPRGGHRLHGRASRNFTDIVNQRKIVNDFPIGMLPCLQQIHERSFFCLPLPLLFIPHVALAWWDVWSWLGGMCGAALV